MRAEGTTLSRNRDVHLVRAQLIEQIESDMLSPGDMLLSEKDLSEHFEVSLRTVRTALQQLSGEGYVYRKPRAGTFVASRDNVSSDSSPATGSRLVFVNVLAEPFDPQEAVYWAEFRDPLDLYLAESELTLEHVAVRSDEIEAFLNDTADYLSLVMTGSPGLYRRILDRGIPCIGVINLPAEDMSPLFDGIGMETLKGAYEATEYLLRQGHREIVHLGTLGSTPTGRERTEGYRQAMEETGLPVDSHMIEYGHHTVQGGYEAMLRLLAKRQEMTAVFAGNDLLAFGAMRALHEVGRRVPEDISIIGFDNWHLSQHTTPPLTTMQVDRARMGQIAGRMAVDRFCNPERKGGIVRLPATLVERDSVCRIDGGKGPQVARN